MLDKAILRREMRLRLRELGATRAQCSRALCEALAGRPEYENAATVALFDPLPSEPDVSLLWEILPRRFVYPRIVDGGLQLYWIQRIEELAHSAPDHPFREPPDLAERRVELDGVDLILVPGLAFSKDGRRLGRGGGYYDRLLSTLPLRTHRIGVCFAFQILPELPIEAHDERVNVVVAG